MKTDKLQIWLCFGIIIVCIAAYILIGCIPWSELKLGKKKHDKPDEPFICPWDVINELTTNKIAKKVFIKDEHDTNKQILNMFVMKTYDRKVEEMDTNMYNKVVNDIVNTIKTNNIDNTKAFVNLLTS